MLFFRKHPRLTTALRVMVLILFIALVCVEASARAGGAGGHSSGGSHSSSRSYSGHSSGGSSGGGSSAGDLMIVYFFFQAIGQLFSFLFATIGVIPTLLICAGIIFLIVWGKRRQIHNATNAWRNMPDPEPETAPRRPSGMGAFLKRNPDFDEDEFTAKVEIAFRGIQEAWSRQDLSPVRRFISDGVYQRFNTQFKMMRLLEQTNPISDLEIIQINIDRADSDQSYDILQVAIRASMSDSFRCALNLSFNQEGDGPFTEYWSFIRRQDRFRKAKAGQDQTAAEFMDIYQSTDCPNCGSPLPADLGERGQCPYCQTMVNSGEYDWVLSEITQAEDYAVDQVIDQNSKLGSGLKLLAAEDPDFCAQLAEDKASNAFMQIVAARAMQDPTLMRRFVDDTAYEKIKQLIPKDHIVYNRLYLNRVSLSSIHQESETNTIAFSLTLSSQRVLLSGKKIKVIDPAMCQDEIMLLMSRSRRPGASKGSLYMHQCANCGAPISDSLDTTCPYCQQAYNSGKQEWVVSNLLSMADYRSWLRESTAKVKAKVNPNLFENLYDVRDYAMSNIMVMIAADGVFADEEKEFSSAMAAKLGFKVDNMQALFELAASGKMGLRMPADGGKREKILAIMVKAASVDGSISPEEQAIIDYLRSADSGNISFNL